MSNLNKIGIIGVGMGMIAMETARLMAKNPGVVEIAQIEDPFAEPTRTYIFDRVELPEPLEYKSGKELRRERRKKERRK